MFTVVEAADWSCQYMTDLLRLINSGVVANKNEEGYSPWRL